MEMDIKNPREQNQAEFIRSLELVSARIFDSIITTSQLASGDTPEMRGLFQQWTEMLGEELFRIAGDSGRIDPVAAAGQIGVSPETVLSLALTLHRRGKIKITALSAEPGDGRNKDICGCLS